jgi:AcrR family transcriptional regulator
VMEMVLAEPAAARLAIVESLTLGAAGVAERERASEAFELMVRQSFEHSPSDYEVGAATVRAITAGLRGVVYRRLRAGEPEQLPALVPDLVDWALGYQGPESEIERRAAAAAAEPRPSTRAGDEVPWTESPDSRRSRAELTQRERIVRAAGRLVIAKGFEALSIPAISNASGTSNQTFYEHFSNKREAFLAAFEESAATGLAATASAFEELGDRPEAVGAAIRAMLEHITANEHFARITFFDLQTAGPLALDYADLVMDSFTAFLQPDRAPSELGAPLPEGVLQAIGSGVWAVIQHEIVAGRLGTLPDMAPQITRVVSSPFGRNAESTA